jgi:hypothetical protein
MKKIETYIAIIGCLLAVFGYFDNKANLSSKVSHLSRVVSQLVKADQDRQFQARVDSAVNAQMVERGGVATPHRHVVSRLDIAKKVALNDSQATASNPEAKKFQLDVKQVELWANPLEAKKLGVVK